MTEEEEINKNLKFHLSRILTFYYNENLDVLKNNNFKVQRAKIIYDDNIKYILYQFYNQKEYKFILHTIIDNNFNEVYGPFDGLIDKFKNIKLNEINPDTDKYIKYTNLILKMRIKELRRVCKNNNLSMIGLKKELISGLLYNKFELKKLFKKN